MEKFVHSCVSRMIECRVIDRKEEAVIIYGLDLLFSSVLAITALLLIGVMIHKETYTVGLLVTFISLQSLGGGFHCKTHLKCWVAMLLGYLFAVYILAKLPIYILWSGAVLCFVCIFKFAPVENEKAPFGQAFKMKMRKSVMIVYFIGVVASMLLLVKYDEMANAILNGMTLSGGSILFANILKMNKK